MSKSFSVLKDKTKLVDQTVASGGDYTPPAEGIVRLRFVGYVEIGKHKSTFKGVESYKPKVHVIFELSGPKHEPKVLEDGTKVPQRITIKLGHSTNSKAAFYRLFLQMRRDREDITHMAEMLGEAFLGRVYHREYTINENGKEVKKIAAELEKDKVFSVKAPEIEKPILDEEEQPTGEVEIKPVKVAEPISELRLFIWSLADKEQWDSLYIEGEHDGRSKNIFQELIVKAQDFVGSVAEAAASGSPALEKALKGNSNEATGGDDEGDGEESAADKKAKAAAAKAAKAKKPPVETTPEEDDLGDIE